MGERASRGENCEWPATGRWFSLQIKLTATT
jgi:hypothetical protein